MTFNGQKKPVLVSILTWLVALLVPVALTLTGVRLMMTSTFLQLEYSMPGFPADRYGFTRADRLHWSQINVDYLLNSAGIEFLGDLRFEDGSAVYNERELRHMVDVKNVVQVALVVWRLSLVGLVASALLAWWGGRVDAYRRGLSRGGFLTAVLLGAIILGVITSFDRLFVLFHQIFFETGTWMFEWSDTLIRCFPERFWMDIFIYVGALALGSGLAIGFGLRNRT